MPESPARLMTLVLNEEELMLRDSAAGFLAEHAPVSDLRALRDARDERGYRPELWRSMAELGWAAIAIEERLGGLGYGYTGLGILLEQVGRTLTASPLESTVLLAATALAELGNDEQREAWLPRIASGDAVISVAWQEGAVFTPDGVALRAVVEGDEVLLDGTKLLVLDAPVAEAFVVFAREAGRPGDQKGIGAWLVPADTPGLTVERRALLDSRTAGELRFNAVRVSSAARLTGASEPALRERLVAVASTGIAAQLLGVATEAFERTVAYLRQRHQFGRPIGSFQALQHRAAELYVELELARSTVLRALRTLDAGGACSLEASAAKAKLCQVAERATAEAIQMHGGVGMTDEYDIGFFIKRARVLQHLFGDVNYHLDRFARLSGF